MNVKSTFTETVILCAADRISSERISLDTNLPNGPHDQAKAAHGTDEEYNKASIPLGQVHHHLTCYSKFPSNEDYHQNLQHICTVIYII